MQYVMVNILLLLIASHVHPMSKSYHKTRSRCIDEKKKERPRRNTEPGGRVVNVNILVYYNIIIFVLKFEFICN